LFCIFFSCNKCGAVEACCPNIKGIKRKLGARHLVPNGEDAFGDKDVTIKFFHKTVDL